jgi:hypothetical protein
MIPSPHSNHSRFSLEMRDGNVPALNRHFESELLETVS